MNPGCATITLEETNKTHPSTAVHGEFLALGNCCITGRVERSPFRILTSQEALGILLLPFLTELLKRCLSQEFEMQLQGKFEHFEARPFVARQLHRSSRRRRKTEPSRDRYRSSRIAQTAILTLAGIDMYSEGIHNAYKHLKTLQPICRKLAKTAPLDCLVYGVLGQNLRCKSARQSQRNEMCLHNVTLSPVLKVSAKGYVAARVISRLPMKGTARSWPKACKTKLLFWCHQSLTLKHNPFEFLPIFHSEQSKSMIGVHQKLLQALQQSHRAKNLRIPKEVASSGICWAVFVGNASS